MRETLLFSIFMPSSFILSSSFYRNSFRRISSAPIPSRLVIMPLRVVVLTYPVDAVVLTLPVQ